VESAIVGLIFVLAFLHTCGMYVWMDNILACFPFHAFIHFDCEPKVQIIICFLYNLFDLEASNFLHLEKIILVVSLRVWSCTKLNLWHYSSFWKTSMPSLMLWDFIWNLMINFHEVQNQTFDFVFQLSFMFFHAFVTTFKQVLQHESLGIIFVNFCPNLSKVYVMNQLYWC